MTNYICIHSHLYQPPRENPWLERIEIQDSAYPYHDWNMRISAECYGPNAASRILDDKGRITQIVNNYEKISFNFGPTLLDWLQRHSSETYKKILAADQASLQSRAGNGNAIAQAYNHMIMPLANRRDKITQVMWGISSFQKHFNRAPQGMWLPETAVDLETLEILADQDIKYTILAPNQAKRIRPLGTLKWKNVENGSIDTRHPYLIQLPCGGSIAIFFYNGHIAHEIAFGGLLASGDTLAKKILADLPPASPQKAHLIHIATDGETFGHHHRYGDMALAYAIDYLEKNNDVKITNYGEYLSLHPPVYEVQIHFNSSWSCVHGVERWRSDCGCNTGHNNSWNQAWRSPLRESLDWLRYKLIQIFREYADKLFSDPWAARNHYIDILHDRSQEDKNTFLKTHGKNNLTEEQQQRAWMLLEMQRNAMLMYTSCGWFFDEISGIEPVQILNYAARAIELARDISGEDSMEDIFLEHLAQATSNIEGMGTGADIYRKFVLPSKVSLQKVVAHAVLSSFFANTDENVQLGCFTLTRKDSIRLTVKNACVAVGRLDVDCTVTESSESFVYAAIQQSLHDFKCAVRLYSELPPLFPGSPDSHKEGDALARLAAKINDAFSQKGIAEVLKTMDTFFDDTRYSLKDIFRDEQQQLLNIIIHDGLDTIEKTFEQAYQTTSFLMGLMESLGHRVPSNFKTAAEIALKREIVKILESNTIDVVQLDSLLQEIDSWNIHLDEEWLKNLLERRISIEAALFRQDSGISTLRRMNEFLTALFLFSSKTNLWEMQNIFYDVMNAKFQLANKNAETNDTEARSWLDEFLQLGHKLFLNMEELAKNLPGDHGTDVGCSEEKQVVGGDALQQSQTPSEKKTMKRC